MAIKRVRSKLAKTEVLIRHPGLRELIPETRRLSQQSLSDMLHHYGMVYVKPDKGTFGKGVIRVERTSTGYLARVDTRSYRFGSIDSLYDGLQRLKRKGLYVVQRGIRLLKHKGRRFDIRVMVQRSPQGVWEATGIIGRLSHPKKIVTNYHSGGTPMAFSTLMSTHLDAGRRKAYAEQLRKLGVTTARQLQRRWPGLKEIGLDIAIDNSLKPWILEVNTAPDPFIFRKLKDKSVFRKIYRYAAAYGRFKKKSRIRSGIRARRRRAVR
ncbi:glutathione synthase/ribosomal protein S6 modification enzyme (glutaminyl transferase) [Thermobacillus composti KWC4]|uniref:Glutathione synthase/ribosomal protein S6 modification enzyme (Glutaminyl transferase) n=1 Tax=Thermobacillus composti (strain DSM 18247 / JCM 13945 / KWC4) TaxID=717605 RepID=L0EJE5_THECK|nr:YheC/YheD family protein [Thermobacillus composti]AGA59769.1 glutathione synthase/ribosomal protein S6 modification enzyme (glutaminyl transferase) [Thermobacillus composti KWC4]